MQTLRTTPVAVVTLAVAVLPLPGQAQAPVLDYDGAIVAGLELRRLGMTGRVLHIAAHPDDENTALLAALALGQGADVAYLSLTRGEGGQNSIGPELSTALGLIRTEELLAARRLDGAAQFFTRAVDYGYSKSGAEALTRWPREELLGDVVEVIRRYRPDVVVSVWSGTELDGHGHHQAAGLLAREAVVAAGDPDRFPEHAALGLRPHAPSHYYRSAWFSERAPDVELDTGLLDPLLGRSYHQVAMASRGLHRSQDQGRRLEPGPRRLSLHLVDPARDEPVASSRVLGRDELGPPAIVRSLFEGVDTLLSQRAEHLPGQRGIRTLAGTQATTQGGTEAETAAETVATSLAGPLAAGPGASASAEELQPGYGLRTTLAGLFREYEALVRAAMRGHNPFEAWRVLPDLLRGQRQLLAAAHLLEDQIAASGDFSATHAARDLHFHVAAELGQLRDAVLTAANVRVDVMADQEWIVPGQAFDLELGVWNGGPAAISAQAGPLLPPGWDWESTANEEYDDAADELLVEPGQRGTASFRVSVPADAEYTTPYFLDAAAPATGTMYQWPDDPEIRGLPFAPGPVRGSFLLLLPGAEPLALEEEAHYVGVDRRDGEYYRPVKVVPAASLSVAPGLVVIPAGPRERDRELTVAINTRAPDGVEGELRLELPAGWTAEPARVPVRIHDDREHSFTFRVTPAAAATTAEYPIGAVLTTATGDLDLGFQVVDHPHISPHNLYGPARARIRIVDVEVAPVRVGYVEGAPDGIPEALDRLGVDWRALNASDLANGELDRYDVIITGTRAYELRPDLVANNQRVLDWARRGGTLIVQYNQYAALDNDYTPWPVTIARPHGRVTDQAAPVQVLEPDHPALNLPNQIRPDDWDGWVQERGLYFLESWQGPLTPLLAMNDAGEEPLTGGLLVAPLGDGTWVYSGLALFRQLPEGVPGAYRLLANLLSLGARP